MEKKNYVFTKDCQFRQQLILGLTGFISLVCILSVFYEHALWALLTSFIVIVVMFATNFLVAKLYRIQKKEQTVVIENIWRRMTYPIESLIEIRLVKFAFPYPFNPYVKFVFKDGKSFQGAIPLAAIVYFQPGIDQYLKELRDYWLSPDQP